MKILSLNASDTQGGAARAGFRIHQGVQQIGVHAEMLVLKKQSDDQTVRDIEGLTGKLMRGLNWRLDNLPIKFYRERQDSLSWSVNWLPFPIQNSILKQSVDLIHLHWIGSSFLPLRLLAQLDKPIVWTLHDSWAFTGGCHLPFDCERYLHGCGNCPQLGSQRNNDLSKWGVVQKRKAYERLNMVIVAPSHWLADRAKASDLLRTKKIVVIPNGLNLTVFKPRSSETTRQTLNLPTDKKIILFGAMNATSDPNKGFQFLQPALQRIAQQGWGNQIELVVLGAKQPENPPDMGFPTHYLGTLNDEALIAQIYSAADVVIVPSKQETLPNTIMEAAACGTPSVAFRIGGIPDLIEHKQTGYLAQPYDVADLAQGIVWVLEHHDVLGVNARVKVEREFEIGAVARRYLAIYEELLEMNPA